MGLIQSTKAPKQNEPLWPNSYARLRMPFSRFLLRSSVLGAYHVIRKEAELLYRTSSSVRLWWEFKEPKGPKGLKASILEEVLGVPGLTPRPCKALKTNWQGSSEGLRRPGGRSSRPLGPGPGLRSRPGSFWKNFSFWASSGFFWCRQTLDPWPQTFESK